MVAVGVAAAFLFANSACEQKKSGEEQANQTETSMDGHEGHDHGSTTSEVNVPDYSNVSDDVKTQVKDIYQSYISVKNGLVESSKEKASEASKQLQEKVEKVNIEKVEGEAKTYLGEQISTVKSQAEKIAAAANVDEQRAQLETLSNSMFSLVKSTGANTETAYYQFCPMANDNKGAYWLSEKKEINNPYFGESMMKCGETKETLSHKM